MLLFEGDPAPRFTKFCHEKLETLMQPTVKIRDSRCQRFDTVPGCDGQMPRPQLSRAKHSAITRKNGCR